MIPGDVWQLLTAALLVVLAGIFTAADAAVAAFSRARAQELVVEGRAGAKRLAAVLEDAPRHLNTALLLQLLCEVAAIVLVTMWIGERIDGWWLQVVITVGVMLLVSFVVIGVAPRTLGRQHAETVALWSAGPLSLLAKVLGPVPQVLITFGNAITPGRGFREGPFSSETELRELVDMAEASEVIEADERKMIHSVFEFGDTTVREVMVPRGDVVYIETHKNLRQTMSLFLRSGFSRVPVIGENLDDVRGFAYLKDVVRRDFEAPDVELTQRVEEIMRPVHWVPESKPVDDLLREMQAMRQHVAIVVDEYGGTAGVATLEDLVEEIVGEVSDEHDRTKADVVRSRDWFTFPGILRPDELRERTGIVVPEEGPFETVAGWLMSELGRLPVVGDTVEIEAGVFRIERLDGRRIDRVRFTPRPSDAVDGGDK